MEKLKKIISTSISCFKRHCIVISILLFVLVMIVLAYLIPSFGEDLERSTKWLSNTTPIIIVLIAYFVKEEIANWHYKRRSEAASTIIGKFRVCSKDLTYWVNARGVTPATGEEAAERKIHLSINKYIESCLEPSSQFPIQIRKDLDNHFEKMRILANTLSGAVTINTSSQSHRTYGKEMALKACAELQSISSTLTDIQSLLDQKLGQYLER